MEIQQASYQTGFGSLKPTLDGAASVIVENLPKEEYHQPSLSPSLPLKTEIPSPTTSTNAGPFGPSQTLTSKLGQHPAISASQTSKPFTAAYRLSRGNSIPSKNLSTLSGKTLVVPSYLINPNRVSCRRVEDLRLNRIDKKHGRRKKCDRRPFVFKSSPLAEGQGIHRITSDFSSNMAPVLQTAFRHSTRRRLLEYGCSSAIQTPRSRGLPCISRFADSLTHPNSLIFNQPDNFHNGPTSKHHNVTHSVASPSPSNLIPSISSSQRSKQPQISSRLRHPSNVKQDSPSQSNMPSSYAIKNSTSQTELKSDYQSWEICLPKCTLPIISKTHY